MRPSKSIERYLPKSALENARRDANAHDSVFTAPLKLSMLKPLFETAADVRIMVGSP
jgi:hypothetical protein